jgi:CBS domain containing-hemolysin-like protein
MTSRFLPLLQFYSIVLFPVAWPTAALLNWWLGPEGIALLREREIRSLITRHVESGGEVGRLEGIGAQNFLDLDDIAVADEGELVDPRSVISLPTANNRPMLPKFARSPGDPFLRQLDASGRKWVIITDSAGEPKFVLDAHHFLRDALFEETSPNFEAYWHRPIVVRDMNTRLGDVIGRMKPERPGDDVIDNDLILIWGKQKRIITGADLLGRLLRGIAKIEEAASRS